MRITARLIAALAMAAAAVVAGATFLQMRTERLRLMDDLERRGSILAESIDTAIDPALFERDRKRIAQFAQTFSNRGRLTGIAVCDAKGSILSASAALGGEAGAASDLAREALKQEKPVSRFVTLQGRESSAYALPLHSDDGIVTGALVIFQDTAYIGERLNDLWRHNFLRLLTQVFLISLVTLWIVRWDVLAPMAQMADWMKRLRAGEPVEKDAFSGAGTFAPVAREVTKFARHLSAAKDAAEEEARLRRAAETLWTAERLKEHVKNKLGGQPLVVVSNREPYMHRYKGSDVEVIVPAGGVVTALDPLLKACGGTGSRTAPATRIGRRSTRRTASGCLPRTLATPCAGSPSPARRRTATTTASPTKASGRCATWRTCAPISGRRTGRITRRPTGSSRMRSSMRSTAGPRRAS